MLGGADPEAYDDEQPECEVRVAGFALAVYPVTNAEFACFVEAQGLRRRTLWTPGGQAWLRGEGKLDPETEQNLRRLFSSFSRDVEAWIASIGKRKPWTMPQRTTFAAVQRTGPKTSMLRPTPSRFWASSAGTVLLARQPLQRPQPAGGGRQLVRGDGLCRLAGPGDRQGISPAHGGRVGVGGPPQQAPLSVGRRRGIRSAATGGAAA